MRRTLVITIVLALAVAGCARPNPPQAGDWPAGVKEAEVYAAVLRRYLGTPAENSFPEHSFATVYVLDHAIASAGDPMGSPGSGTPIAENTQRQVKTALAGTAEVLFIADRDTVLENQHSCAQVKNGGILITLGPPDGDDNEVTVAINGFVACLGATWLTYRVRNEAGSGWRVTGTTGPMAIS